MQVYALLPLLASVVSIFLGNFIYYINPENRLNKLVALLCILVSFLAFIEFGYRQAETMATAEFWLKLSGFWPLVPAILINIALIFTDRSKILKKRWVVFMIYAPALIISAVGVGTNLLITGAVQSYWGWTYDLEPVPPWFIILSLWTIIAGLYSAFLVFNHYSKVKDRLEKKQAQYIFIGFYTPLILSLMTDLILPFISIRIPEFTMILITLGLIFISYGIWKYRFPVLTPAMAADKIISTMSNLLIILNPKRDILLVNRSTLKLLGYSKEELIGKNFEFIIKGGKQEDDFFQNMEDLSGTRSIKTFETTLKTKNNRIVPVLMSVSPIKISEKEQFGFVCIGSDLTKEKKMKKALKESEKLYATLVETDPDSVITMDLKGKIVFVSPNTLQMYGFINSGEIIGKSFTQFIIPECHKKVKFDLQKTLKKSILRNIEYVMLRKDRSQFIGEVNLATVQDVEGNPVALMATARDITHHKNIEKKMQDSLQEKEILLKEIHHRVKNNLQIISSLLSLQSSYIRNKEAFEVFKESQNRVKTMAIIHEKLYQSEDFTGINLEEYIQNLLSSIYSSYGITENMIQLNANTDNIFLDIDTCIPCGLIINELVTNAIKHAFPDGRKGRIDIDFYKKNGTYVLMVKDNGVGLPADLDLQHTKTLGLRLISSLVSQLEGDFEVTREGGTQVKISFKD